MTRSKPWDYLSILLILICTWLPAAMLRTTAWSKGLVLVEIMAVTAAIAGLGLGRTKLSSSQVNALFFFLSVVVPPVMFMFAVTTSGGLVERFGVFITRMNLALTQAVVGRVIQDSILFTFFCGYFFWLIGYFAGYGYSRRGNPWQGLLAAAVIFGVIVFYTGSSRMSEWIGAGLVFCLFLLAARLYWEEKRAEWIEKRYRIEPDAGRSVFIVASLICLFLVFAGWNLQAIILSLTPGTPEQERFTQFMKDIQSGVQTNIPALQSSTSLTGTYPGGLKLGSQAPLQPTEAFLVKVVSTTQPVSRYYWRVRAYDQYANSQWRAPDITNLNGTFLQPEELGNLPSYSQAKIQYIWQAGDGTIIPYAGRLSGTDILNRFEAFPGNGGTTGDGILFPQQPLARNSLLMVDSAVFVGRDVDLRAVISPPPPEVNAQYLALPASVPQRVIDLGRQLAVGQTVYDRVAAVTEYLRNGYEYRSQITPVPLGKDPVDWFLFDSKQGFCNYFASAEVVLLRAAGIPSRLAVGYSQGEPTADGFQVRVNNGHAWPEVYFAGVGWVPFEPTASEPDTPYSTAESTEQDQKKPENQQSQQNNIQPPPSDGPQPNAEGDTDRDDRPAVRWILPLILVFIAVLCGAGIWLGFKKKIWKKPPRITRLVMKWLSALHWRVPDWLARWDWYNSLPEPGKQYVQLDRLARMFRMSTGTPQTPYELLDGLAAWIPENAPDLAVFKSGLYTALYSPQPAQDDEKCRAAGTALQKALWKAFWKRLFHIQGR